MENIVIAPGVVYPSDEARQWIADNVTAGEAESADRFGRPVTWRTETETAVVTVEREYINANRGSWARRRDVVTVTGKGGEL